MDRRITLWTAVGFFVACGWTLYAFAEAPDTEVRFSLADRVVQGLAYLTCPAAALGVRFYWVIPLNAVTYALLGSLVEF